MTMPTRILIIGLGLFALCLGLAPKARFHPGMMGITNRNRTISPWLGRPVFIGLGVAAIYLGLKS